jgi:hypothetical protein
MAEPSGARSEVTYWPPVPRSYEFYSVQISFDPDEPTSVFVEAPGIQLSPDEARRVATHLLEAADRCEDAPRSKVQHSGREREGSG